MTDYVVYLRVSTQRQGASGLGLEAQRASVNEFTAREGVSIISEFVEVESGKKSDRPELSKAIALAKKKGAILLIAKLDRLARNVAFIANLLESGIEIRAVDLPEANRFVFHIMAAVAEQEGKAISERTKAALSAAKAKGVKLGFSNPMIKKHHESATKEAVKAKKKLADSFALKRQSRIESLRKEGMSFRAIAKQLNDEGTKTFSGALWYATTVKNIIGRKVT